MNKENGNQILRTPLHSKLKNNLLISGTKGVYSTPLQVRHANTIEKKENEINIDLNFNQFQNSCNKPFSSINFSSIKSCTNQKTANCLKTPTYKGKNINNLDNSFSKIIEESENLNGKYKLPLILLFLIRSI